MGYGAPGRDRKVTTAKSRKRPLRVWRFLGRVAATGVALLLFAMIAVQMARVIRQNLGLKTELSQTQDEIAHLQARRAWQVEQLRRLQDPEGAVPEIHDRLHLVRPNEAIVFLKPMASPLPSSTP
jgi:cell division protein FtsB